MPNKKISFNTNFNKILSYALFLLENKKFEDCRIQLKKLI
jgi:hypothetical protein